MTERDIEAIASWTHERTHAPTGPRREPPGICPVCGEPVDDRPFFGDATCGDSACRDAMLRRPR